MDSNGMIEIKKDFAKYLLENKNVMDQINKDVHEFLNRNSALIAKFGFESVLNYACERAIQKHIKTLN
jgi:uncharacterized protein YpiB (UPF0302 family)